MGTLGALAAWTGPLAKDEANQYRSGPTRSWLEAKVASPGYGATSSGVLSVTTVFFSVVVLPGHE
jgi:hypothetical protein